MVRRDVSTSTAGIRVLVDWLKEQDVSVAAYEPTGGYEPTGQTVG